MEVIHNKGKLVLVFEYLDMDLKKYFSMVDKIDPYI
jgi:hypothetical protein